MLVNNTEHLSTLVYTFYRAVCTCVYPVYLRIPVCTCVYLVSAPDPPCTHKKRKESAKRGSGAVDTEGLFGM